jgi:transglutaminase-like putative cysteine protease
MKKSSWRTLDWLALICIFFLFILAANRLRLTDWADQLGVVGWLLIFGTLLGLLLGRWRIHWLLDTIAAILLSAVLFPLVFTSMLSEKAGLIVRLLAVWERILSTANQLLAGQPVTDSILFLLVSGLLFWTIGLITGNALMRSGKPWLPLLLLGAGLLVIEHYQQDPRRAFYTWAYAVVLVILLGRLFYLRLRQEITASGQPVGNDTEFDFNRGVLFAALLIGLSALLAPRLVHLFVYQSSEQTFLSQKWERFTQNFDNVFYALNQNQLSREDEIADDLSLGTGQIQGDAPVLYYQFNSPAPLVSPLYWRGKSYSVYGNSTWYLGNSYKQYYPSFTRLSAKTAGQSQVKAKFWVQSLLPELIQVYTTGEVSSFSRTVDAAVSTETIYDKEILAFFVDPGLQMNEIYRFDALLSMPTATELDLAGLDYPDWVIQRYLQVPSDVTERMVVLAGDLTAGKQTPYQKAVSVTQYLRTNYEYQAVIPAPPRKADPVDWFLFDYKKGFCNYYASAEVLLLRIAGVPARLSVGYTQGIPDGSGNGFTVYENDSHAWPEVYFPGYGWIPFEPTASQPEVDWAVSASSQAPPLSGSLANLGQQSAGQPTGMNGEERANRLLEQMETGTATPLPQRKLSTFGYILLGLAGALLTGGLTFAGIKISKNWLAVRQSAQQMLQRFLRGIYRIPLLGFWLRTIGLKPVQRDFAVIEFGLLLLGEKVRPGFTAQELAGMLQARIPSLEAEIQYLLAQYQEYTYSKHSVTGGNTRRVARQILWEEFRLWWNLKAGRVRAFFDRF